jgi:putative membrane protein
VELTKRLAWTWLANTVAILVAVLVIGGVHADRLWTIVVAGFVFTAVNLFVRPAVKLLALPLIAVTFGVALYLVNMLMLLLTSMIVDAFSVDSVGALALGTLVIWLVNIVLVVTAGMAARSSPSGQR